MVQTVFVLLRKYSNKLVCVQIVEHTKLVNHLVEMATYSNFSLTEMMIICKFIIQRTRASVLLLSGGYVSNFYQFLLYI